MVEISNNVMAVMLLAAIVVSISGTTYSVLHFKDVGYSPVAMATVDTGKTNFSIQNALSIRFVNNLIPFASGYVNTSGGQTSCEMGSNNSPPSPNTGCAGFNTTVDEQNLTIENDGNILANVSINFTNDASTFIGGTTPLYRYHVTNNEAGSCTTIQNGSSMKDVGTIETDGTNARICTNLSTENPDLIAIAIWISVPEDAASGEHTSIITATACDDGSC